MKILLHVFVSILATSAFAGTTTSKAITPSEYQPSIASVETAVTVGRGYDEENQIEHLHKIIVVDNGLSTDVSPRYSVYYAYQMISEMANPSVLYRLGSAISYSNIRRKSAGLYSIDIVDYDYDTFQKVTKTLSVRAGRIQQEVESQVGDFEDGPIGGALKLSPLVLRTTTVTQPKQLKPLKPLAPLRPL